MWTAPDGDLVPNEKQWDPATDMPPELWVKGVKVSDTGPTATECGPEHMCLEAINNGAPYLYDRVAFTTVETMTIDVTSDDEGSSRNPPPFSGHTSWPFDVTRSPSPDKHAVIFHHDVVTSLSSSYPLFEPEFSVFEFDFTLETSVMPTCITDDMLDEVWRKIGGPAGGDLDRTDTFSVKYESTDANPMCGGVYRFEFDLGLNEIQKSEANVVLPLAGAEVYEIFSDDLDRADSFAARVNARYSRWQRNRPANVRRWFFNDTWGDYLGRADNIHNPTVWVYNQVDDGEKYGYGSVATLKGVPIRVARMSNFIVAYAARKIGGNYIAGRLAGLIFGTPDWQNLWENPGALSWGR